MESAMECYNFAIDEEEDDPHNINIPESEGSHDVQGPALEIPEITKKVKIRRLMMGQRQTLSLLPLETTGMMRL